MKQPTKKQLAEYDKKVNEKAKKFNLSGEDLHNLYDMFHMVEWQDYDTFKLNKMDGWFKKFFIRVEKIIIPELYEEKK